MQTSGPVKKTALEEKQEAIRRKVKAVGPQENLRVAQALKIGAENEYNKSSYLWCAFYKLDRVVGGVTGLAMTNNTQKILDAAVLEQVQAGPKA